MLEGNFELKDFFNRHEGRMLHEDHKGNKGLLGPGAVQWMTAGRGIVHSGISFVIFSF
jgi:hypothetical protein